MTHAYMYPRVTQIASRAHSVPASRLFPGGSARGAADLLSLQDAPPGNSTRPPALGVPARAIS